MAHILTDRVRETTTTTGTGAVTLGGAVTGYQDFDSQMANADTTAYAIVHRTANEWEVGLGTWNTGNTFTRTTVVRSTNGNAAVNLSAGTKDIFMTFTPSVRTPGLAFTSAPVPATSDLAGLGSDSLMWADLYLSSGGQIRWNAGNSAITHTAANQLTIGSAELVTSPTTTTRPGLTLDAGTLMTTPTEGAVEADATNFYGTTDAGNRGYIPIKHFIRAAANQTLTSTTAEQSFFDSPANGRVTLETGTYKFEWMGNVTGMSATSGNARFDILGAGSATMTFPIWYFNGVDNTNSNTISADMAPLFLVDTTAASAVTAGTGTALRFWAQGMFEITGAGTVQPALALVTAAAATVQRGSFYMVERVGATGVVSVGQWD